jgi:AbiV family abortive infection protein
VTSKRLTPEDVHAVGVAALENAVELMRDAAALVEAGRPRRAYALGVIAVEEVAKHYRCRTILHGWTGAITVVELNAELRPVHDAHVERFAETLAHLGALAPSAPMPPGFDDLVAVARNDIDARERVLYVEVAPNGAPMTPEGVSEDEARRWVTTMVGYFAGIAGPWRHTLEDALEDALEKVNERSTDPDRIAPPE